MATPTRSNPPYKDGDKLTIETETFAMALERTGNKKQMMKTCEECGELIQSIMKMLQIVEDINPPHPYSFEILKEMSHVDLCLDAIKYDLKEAGLLLHYNRIKSDRLESWNQYEHLMNKKRNDRIGGTIEVNGGN